VPAFEANTCTGCGEPIPPDTAGALCPVCSIRDAKTYIGEKPNQNELPPTVKGPQFSLQFGSRLGQFEIGELLGAGGMGEVYRAFDTKLHRDVAIKVLPENLANDVELLARFEREAKTLAALDHPNIASVYDFRVDEGTHFLVLQLIEGQTLADRIRRGPIPIPEVVGLLKDIAHGLAASHDKDIIHRDLKPANIKITPNGTAVVLDFGIAKGVDALLNEQRNHVDKSDSPRPKVSTVSGAIIGTPGYMSPEQARGEALEGTSDIWSFGCCLFESLAGESPFIAPSTAEMLASILYEVPDWSQLPQHECPALISIVQRCLQKEPSERPSSFHEIAKELDDIASPLNRESREGSTDAELPGDIEPAGEMGPVTSHLRWRIGPKSVLFAMCAIAFLLAGTWIWQTRQINSRPNALNTKAGDEGIRPVDTNPPATNSIGSITSLVVLPFDNASGNPNEEYFVDGMTDTLTAELAKIRAVSVVARSSAQRYKSTVMTPQQIGEELGADGVVLGSVERLEDALHITARLVDGRTNDQLWSADYSASQEDILQLQGNIAVAIADRIGAVISPDVRSDYEEARTGNATAWDLYFQARTVWKPRSLAAFAQGIEYLEHAIRLDPEFADAHALLALMYATRPLNMIPDHADYARASDSAARALRLDARAIDAHLALTLVAVPGNWDWEDGSRHIQAAFEIDPDHASAHMFDGSSKAALGNIDEAVAALRRAVAHDPQSPTYRQVLTRVLLWHGSYEEVLVEAKRTCELAPGWEPRVSGESIAALCALEKFEEAQEYLRPEMFFIEAEQPQWEAYIYEAMGRREEALAIIDSYQKKYPGVFWRPVDLLARVGRADEALQMVEDALVQSSDGFLTTISNPAMHVLWDQPRYWELLALANMPAYGPDHPAYKQQQAYLAEEDFKRALTAQTRTGTWSVRFSDGSRHRIQLDSDGSAIKMPGDITGTWRVEGDLTLITWRDGWRDAIHPGLSVEIWAHAPGANLVDPPTAKGEARKIGLDNAP